jgi:outer membrane biosynthesis protein TonB
MGFLDTTEKRKSFAITAAVMSFLLLFFCFVSVLTHLDPPPENGIAINFGNSNVGSGSTEPALPTQTTPSTPDSQPTTTSSQEVVTQDAVEAPVVSSQPDVKNNSQQQQQPEPEKQPEPKPDQSVLDALNSVTSADTQDGKTPKGEGDDNKPGNKGKINGDPYANSYYGKDGVGSGGKGYGLNGRSRLRYTAVQQECNETGTVVVKISVNRSGEVIDAVPGEQGTTNRVKCLMDAAYKSAMSYRFSAAPDAKAAVQIGFVVVVFKLGE